MKMNLCDRYAGGWRASYKLEGICFYNSETKEIFNAIELENVFTFIVNNDGSITKTVNFEIEYKQSKSHLINLASVNEANKNDYVQVSKYSCIEKEAFNNLKGNVRIGSTGRYIYYFMFIDLSKALKNFGVSVIKYSENDFIEYWCKCLFIQLNENIFLKIPYYTNCFTKLKKAYFRMNLINKLANNRINSATKHLDVTKEMLYSEIRWNSNWELEEVCKYFTDEMLEQALKNKKELLA